MVNSVPEKVMDSNTDESDEKEDTFSVDEAVFIKQKPLFQPAKVIEVNARNIVVQIFHIKTIINKTNNDLKKFMKDPVVTKGHSPIRIMSFKEACKHEQKMVFPYF